MRAQAGYSLGVPGRLSTRPGLLFDASVHLERLAVRFGYEIGLA